MTKSMNKKHILIASIAAAVVVVGTGSYWRRTPDQHGPWSARGRSQCYLGLAAGNQDRSD